MSLESLILRKAEKRLQPYRVEGNKFKDKNLEYQNYLPYIIAALEKTTYWHGTGRYHYLYQGESRYESIHTDNLLDVLDSIIKHDGLIPHQDPWIDSGGKTVSLGTVRMHSRLFARLHLYECDTLCYEFGNVRYWVRLYMNFLLLWLLSNLNSCRQFLKSLFRRSSYRDFQAWASAIRKPRGRKVLSIWDVAKAKTVSSDIQGNYPILIGIGRETLEVIDTIPLTHAVELRSLNPVTLHNFTHLEVPLAKVKETQEFLKSKGISLPILPLEFVDAYMCDIPIRALAYS